MTITAPTPEAAASARSTSASPLRCSSPRVISTAGSMPHAPAVGAAQMRPMAALVSLQDSARAISRFIMPPHMVRPPAA